MNRILFFLKIHLLPLGGIGIFTMTFLDSTFVPLPSIMDLTYIGFCLARRALIPYYCLAATAGSVAGCYVLFTPSRRGSIFAKKRLSIGSKPAFEALGRHGGKALFLASLMPPPFPFKVFVFASGMFPISPWRFILAIAAGRGFRFIFEGTFAFFYGDMVIAYMKKDFARLSLIIVGIMVLLFLLSSLAKRRFMKETP